MRCVDTNAQRQSDVKPLRINDLKAAQPLKTGLRTIALTIWLLLVATSPGQEPETIKINFTPQAAPAVPTAIRFLPSDPELKDGNAAVVMLRITYEQQAFMNTVVPKFRQLMELPFDDPRIRQEVRFRKFKNDLRRAAYLRDADWNYPMDEGPLATILLPDVQVMRQFVHRGMHLWIGGQIAAGNLVEAREGVLIQLACARHLARTPFIVNRMVAEAAADSALDRVQLMMSQPECPNLYWALALLPDALGDNAATLQWESQFLIRSLPSLAGGIPPPGDDRWKDLAQEFSDYMETRVPDFVAAAKLRENLMRIARKQLADILGYDNETLDQMIAEELVMRWVLMVTTQVNAKIEAAYELATPAGLAALVQLEAEIQQLMNETGTTESPFSRTPVATFVGFHRFDRGVKQLQVIESIRDYVASEGHLPESLQQTKLPAPLDPLTAAPFEYTQSGESATLRSPQIPGINDKYNQLLARVHELSVAAK